MTISDDMRQAMLREAVRYNAKPMPRPGDVTAQDLMKAAKEEGRNISRCQAYRWLDNMVATAGWETELVFPGGRKTRVWRKPATNE